MPPQGLSDADLKAWAKAHSTQTHAALANVDADRALDDDDDDDAPVCEAVHLHGTNSSFVFFHRNVGDNGVAYDIWRCANAREAEAIAEARSHSGHQMRTDTMLGVSRAAVAQQALLIAAKARKKGKVQAPAGAEDAEGPDDAAGAAGFSPARSREEPAGGEGGGMDDDDAFASPQRKKQKKAAAKGPSTTPAGAALFTPAPVEAPVPASGPHLVPAAPRAAALPPAEAHAAPQQRSSTAERVAALEAELAKTQRKLKQVTRTCEKLAEAQEAQRAASEAFRASLHAALMGAAAALVPRAAPGAA